MIYNKFRYAQRTPLLVSNTVSNADEITRWLLDLNGIPYRNRVHAPGLHISPSNKASGIRSGIANNPVYKSTDALSYEKDGFFQYIEPLLTPASRLLPGQPAQKQEATELYERIWHTIWRPVDRYVYHHILPHKKTTLPVVTKGVPYKEKLIYRNLYPRMAKAIASGLKLDRHKPEDDLAIIENMATEMENRLQNGPYLMGEQFTIADIAYATVMAPLVLPEQFGGSQSRLEDYPQKLQQTVNAFRNREAGKFVLRIYKDHRGTVCDQKTLLPDISGTTRFRLWLKRKLLGPRFFARAFYFTQKHLPVIKFKNNVVISRFESVQNLLNWDREYTIEEINGAKMKALHVPFFLGMDRGQPHDREIALMRKVVRREDPQRIRKYVREAANDIISSTCNYEKIDVVASVTRPVMVRLIADYFGVPGPENMMKQWLRTQFYDLFLNLGDDKKVHRAALKSAGELRDHLNKLIADYKEVISQEGTDALPDNLLCRLLKEQHKEQQEQEGYGLDGNTPLTGGRDTPFIDDDLIRRNITGIIVGALETTSKAVVLALDELFRREEWLESLSEAAKRGEMEMVTGYVKEALRFNPFNPVVIRHAKKTQEVDIPGRKRPAKIEKGSKVWVNLASAMMDGREFPEPRAFIPHRKSEYMLFGYGYHECFGKYMNLVTIPEFVAAVMRLSKVRPAPGLVGKGGGLYDGPFPNNYLVEYEFNAF